MRPHPAAIAASLIVALEGLVVLWLAALEIQGIAGGESAEITSAVALLVLTVIMGAGMIAFAWGILRGQNWGRSGGIVTQILVFAIGLGAVTGVIYPHVLLGLTIMVPGILGFVLILLATRRDPAER